MITVNKPCWRLVPYYAPFSTSPSYLLPWSRMKLLSKFLLQVVFLRLSRSSLLSWYHNLELATITPWQLRRRSTGNRRHFYVNRRRFDVNQRRSDGNWRRFNRNRRRFWGNSFSLCVDNRKPSGFFRPPRRRRHVLFSLSPSSFSLSPLSFPSSSKKKHGNGVWIHFIFLFFLSSVMK